jgi:high-affinity nickel-transport protein
MTHATLLALAFALGMRHGLDPDHLAVIDGLSYIYPSRLNGILFAVGHGVLVTLLAVGVGSISARVIEPYAPWFLIIMGIVNLWRLCRPIAHKHRRLSRFPTTSPLLLGIIFGAGFETASQLSAFALVADINPWILGATFSGAMILVDGADGYLAAQAQRNSVVGNLRAVRASRILGVLISTFSFVLGGTELLKINLDGIALPLGCILFATLIVLRLWSARSLKPNHIFARLEPITRARNLE